MRDMVQIFILINLLIGTRKHPKKQAVIRKTANAGLTNPLQLITSKSMFSASSFSDMNISEKLVSTCFRNYQ